MADKKNNDTSNMRDLRRSYHGKEYSIIDIQNLKEANKQMEEQLKLQRQVVKQQEKFVQDTERKLAQGRQVSDLDRAIYNDAKKQQENLIRLTAQVNRATSENNRQLTELTRNWNRYISDTMRQQPNSQQFVSSVIQQGHQQMSGKPMPKSISDLFRQSLTDIHSAREQRAVNNVYQKVADSVTAKYKRQGADFTDAETMQKMNQEIQEETLKKSEKIIGKFGKGAEWINVAADTFSKAVNVWGRIFRAGMDNQSQAYEDTFTNVSVRNGTTRQNYADAKWKMNNYLDEQGLRNNIASSEVYRMWDKMATSGIQIDLSNEESRAEISAKAIDNVLTSKIVPYLDTSTAQWDQLVSAQPELQKNIRGINRLNTDLVGNNYATKDLLQNILDDLQPIADSALNDLAMSASGATTFINSMMESGMDEATAKSLWTEYYKQQQYGAQILRSGTTNEKMSLVNATVNGINIMDSEDTPEALANIARTRLTTSNYGPGYGSTMDAIVQSSVNGSVGTDPRFAMWAYSKGNKALESINEAEANGNRAIELHRLYGKMVGDDYANDTNQTNKKLQEITVENLMNELSVINDWLGHWSGVIETAIKGIGAILLTKLIGGVIGKGIGLLSGVGGATATASSGGLFASLGAAGPIGLGIAAVGASVAAGVAIGSKMLDIAGKEQGEAQSDYAAQTQAKGYDTSTSNTVGKVQSITQFDRGSFLGQYKNNLSGDEKDQLGINKNFWLGTWDEIGDTKGKAWDNKQWYKYNNMAWLRSGFAFNVGGDILDDKNVLAAAIMYAIALDQMGMLGSTKETNPLVNWGADIKTKEDIGNAIRYGISEGLFTGWSSIHASSWLLADEDAGPRDLEGKLYGKDITKDVLPQYGFNEANEDDKYFMSHRQGLNTVPYDEYPALLHQGEAVLTAATANELRSLLDEYRDTTQQTVNFDNIIRTQTQDLITKMDEIKQVMINSNSSIGNFTDTLQQTKAKEILYTSMKHVHSTKSF